MSVKADLATGHVDANGDQFSEPSLRDILEQAQGKHIYLDFDRTVAPVGRITGARKVGCAVEVDAELDKRIEATLRGCANGGVGLPAYITTAFVVKESHLEGETRVYDRVQLIECALTVHPVDLNQRPIFEISEDHEG